VYYILFILVKANPLVELGEYVGIFLRWSLYVGEKAMTCGACSSVV